MSVTFSSLNLKTNTATKVAKINETEVEVLQYLPAADKNSLLEITVQEADMGTVVNTFAIDCLFHLHLVMKYTNIDFGDSYDKFELYDMLESNGIINQIVEAIPQTEYNELKDALVDMLDKYAVYRNSFKASLEQLQMFAPQQAEEMKKTIEEMDFSDVEKVISLANNTGIQYIGQ